MRRLRLGDAVEIKHGYAFSGAQFSEDVSYPTVLTPGNFALGGGFRRTRPKTFLGAIPSGYELEPGSLIVTMTDLSKSGDTLGLPAIVPAGDRYLHNQRIGLVQVRDSSLIHREFLAYYLRTKAYREHVLGTATGSTVKHTSPSRIEAFVGEVPEIGEQRAIAGVLAALDGKIAANDRVIEVADELRSSLVATSPSTVAVGRIASQRARSVSPGAFAAIVDHYSLPAFDAGARPDRADRDSIKSNKFAVDGPSVLMSKLNPRIPRVWEVLAPSVTAVASTEFVVLAPDGVSTSELWAALRAPAATAALSSQVAGTSGSHQRVKPADILALEVADPRGLAVGVRALIDALGADTECRRAESERLAVTRNELLPLLMSGKVRVRDAEKRVEEVL